MASRRCGQKRHAVRTGTTIRQQESYSHEMANREYHMYLTTRFLLMHPLLLTAEIYVFYNYVLALDDVTHIMFHPKLI
jgi:hypothetical protein